MITYKGYIGAVNFDPEIDLFHGAVINTTDVITFYGAFVTELRVEMQKSLEGYVEFCREQGKIPEKPFSKGIFYMTDLKNTIAHILEHKQHLAEANEATIQQYVVLPILRSLGWDDANLASVEVLPQYAVKGGQVDYALKVGQKLALFIECKKWKESLDRHEDQVVTYAVKAGIPIVGLTNGKIWRFYFSWREGTSVSDRIFCETDIEDREAAVTDLEKYLLKSNVASGEAELNAEIALEEKAKEDITSYLELGGEWTTARVKDSLSPKLIAFYEKICPEERLELFYRGIAGVQNLIEKQKWRLSPPKVSKMLCGFWLTNKGVIGNIKRIFGILHDVGFPVLEIIGRDGELIKKTRASIPPRFFVRITEEEARQLERKYDGCEFCGVSKGKSVDYVYYNIPEDILKLRPVLEFAYNKHRGS